MSRVLKWDVLADGGIHTIGGGPVLHVEDQNSNGWGQQVQVWTLEDDLADRRQVAIFGTGQPLPNRAKQHLGSAVCANGNLVWHLFEIEADQ